MVLCKYFQQGNCRYGQLCKFTHSYGNRSKTFGGDDKNIALLVAEEVLVAERGGQWLLSCFGPFKEKKCIPGMEDLSPEELRWEMYQAQKNGTVDQVNVQFQKMCEEMKSKRDALKNPTTQIYQMLEEIKNGVTSSFAFGDASKTNQGNNPFGQSQLSTPNANQTSNVFGQKPFGTTPSTNVFGASNNFSTQQQQPLFGGNASFGSAPVFGGSSAFGTAQVSRPNSYFGSTSTTTSASSAGVFGTTQVSQANPFFANTAAATTPAGSTGVFGSTQVSQQNTFFGTTTSTSSTAGGFGGLAAARPNPFFANSANTTSSATAPAFGGAPTFGGSSFGVAQSTGSVFGGQAFGAAGTTGASNSIFGATGVTNAPNSIFGGSANTASFGALAQNPTNVFGSAPTTMASSSNAFDVAPNVTPFGTASTATPAFGSSGSQAFAPAAAQTQGVFGSQAATSTQGVFASQVAAPAQGIFGSQAATTAQGVFGSQTAAPAQGAFGNQTTSAPGVFGNQAAPPAQGVFGSQAATPAQGAFGSQAAPFPQNTPFGFQTPATNATTSTNVFGAPTNQSVFGASAPVSSNQSVFGATTSQSSTSVFGTSSAPPNANPFLANASTTTSSPFGSAPSNQASPFGAFAKTGAQLSVTVIVDETAYTPDENLTDDEKAAYRSTLFVEGQIPLKPPSKELC
ncbi:hypothetical protein QAD02_018995 [Eretmocerus hayati]|uniref:Uncharacterized protein n=1 Tax=Eretmocerus hayati TaxID=131215 RepID=A0ACC2PJI8_9HYME|nr:hypothetical protein QAD02_018995 [Eretmocerus hayati]